MKKIFALILFIAPFIAQAQVTGLELPYGVKVLDTLAADAWYGPYPNIDSALSHVPEGVRKNRTVLIGIGSDKKEYIWLNGNADEDLVVKFVPTETLSWDSITSTPTTVAGYGITDMPFALVGSSSLIDLRSNITPESSYPLGSIVMGAFTATANSSSGGSSNIFGTSAASNATGLESSNVFGANAGQNSTNIIYSNLFGYNAGKGMTGGFNNVFGSDAGVNSIMTNSNIFGLAAGTGASGSSSNLFGNLAGYEAETSYSNLFGYRVGRETPGISIGNNNIIIGTSITLPNATSNAINIGAVLYGSGTNSDVSDPSYPTASVSSSGKIGIQVLPANQTATLGTTGTSSQAPFRIHSTTAPSSPNNGDIWIGGDHLYVQLDGSSYQLDQQVSDTLVSLNQIDAMLDTLGGGGSPDWGDIGGDMGDQEDLIDSLAAKANLAGATFTGKVNFTADATNAGINIGVVSGDPSSTAMGDLWINSANQRIGVASPVSMGATRYFLYTLATSMVSGRIPTMSASGQISTDANFTYVSGTLGTPSISVSTGATLPAATTIGTVSDTEIAVLDGLTASTAELNTLDGITATVTELNYTDGVTSNIQTQLDDKQTITPTTATGTSVAFDTNRSYCTSASPCTGNITFNSSGAVVGQMATMIHNSGSEPTFGSEFIILSGEYVTSEDNYIMFFLRESGKVWVTISQEQ